MEAIVTGAAGFIGSNVARQLLEAGHSVVGIDDLNDAYDPALKRWRLDQLRGRPGFEYRRADIAEREELAPVFAGRRFEIVFNLAARAGVRQSLEDPWTYVRTNVVGTLNLLEAARTSGVRRFVLASTSSLYGNSDVQPFLETSTTDRPLSPYAASKKGAESMLASYSHLYGLDATVLRYFTVYGPAGRPDMSVFRFVRNIVEGDPIVVYGDGSQRRDFTYIDDIARGTIAAARCKGFDIINLGGDQPVRLDAMVAAIEEVSGKRATIDRRPLHPADVHATWAGIAKARESLGWEPRVGLKEGIARSVAWYMENRDWASKLSVGAT